MGYKIYEHLTATYFSTDVMVDGKRVNIVFQGASRNNPIKITAKFTTDSKAVQKAVEARSDFGKTIRLFQDCKEEEEVVEAIKEPEKPAPAITDPEPKGEPETPPTEPEKPAVEIPEGFEAISGVETAVEAKNILLDRFEELKHGDLKNTAMIKEVAAKYKIIFTDLA